MHGLPARARGPCHLKSSHALSRVVKKSERRGRPIGTTPLLFSVDQILRDLFGLLRSAALELPQRLGVERELIAARTEQIAMAKLRQRQADGLARHAHRLGELMMRDPQDNAVVRRRRGRRMAEANQRLDEPIVAVLEDQVGRIVVGRLNLGRQLAAQFQLPASGLRAIAS